MKKLSSLFIVLAVGLFVSNADAYQVLSSKELGKNDARNQNVVVKCTTDTGQVSTQTCTLRRYVKCSGTGTSRQCGGGWQPWKDLRDPNSQYSDWRTGALACCKAKGLR